MKLLNFKCRRLNGYIDKEIQFHNNISFLVGINGSGKTSVLRAITSIFSLDIDWIINTKFDEINVEFYYNKKNSFVKIIKDKDHITFSGYVNDNKYEEPLTADYLRRLEKIYEEYIYDTQEGQVTLRDSRYSVPFTVNLFKEISELPSPIYLGLDRSTLPLSAQRRTPGTSALSSLALNAARKSHPTLRTYMDESLQQAEILASRAYQKASIKRGRSAQGLRNKMLLSVFSAEQRKSNISIPKPADIRKYQKTKSAVFNAYRLVGADISPESNKEINIFFDNLIFNAQKLLKYNSISDAISSGDQESFFSWADATPRLNLLYQFEKLVTTFNDENKETFKNINSFKHIMSEFLNDSNKSLEFHEDGRLSITLPSTDRSDVFSLSSGERQLFVLISNLIFNKGDRESDILIIDEPELSLHLKWQDMFVDSIMQASPNIQIILATHSPSIIGDKYDNCVQL